MNRVTLLVEWDEDSAIGLAETVWNAGGTVRILSQTPRRDEFGSNLQSVDPLSDAPDHAVVIPIWR